MKRLDRSWTSTFSNKTTIMNDTNVKITLVITNDINQLVVKQANLKAGMNGGEVGVVNENVKEIKTVVEVPPGDKHEWYPQYTNYITALYKESNESYFRMIFKNIACSKGTKHSIDTLAVLAKIKSIDNFCEGKAILS